MGLRKWQARADFRTANLYHVKLRTVGNTTIYRASVAT